MRAVDELRMKRDIQSLIDENGGRALLKSRVFIVGAGRVEDWDAAVDASSSGDIPFATRSQTIFRLLM